MATRPVFIGAGPGANWEDLMRLLITSNVSYEPTLLVELGGGRAFEAWADARWGNRPGFRARIDFAELGWKLNYQVVGFVFVTTAKSLPVVQAELSHFCLDIGMCFSPESKLFLVCPEAMCGISSSLILNLQGQRFHYYYNKSKTVAHAAGEVEEELSRGFPQ